MKCSNCGAEIQENSLFCDNCGTSRQPDVINPVTPSPKPRRKGLLITLVIVLAVIIIGGGVYALFGSDLKRMILGNEKTYISIENKSLRQNAASLVKSLVKYGNEASRPQKSGQLMDISFVLPGDKSSLPMSLATVLQNITIQQKQLYDRSGPKPLIYNKVGLLSKNETLLTVEAFYNSEQVVVGIPELLDKYLVAKSADIDKYLGLSETGSAQGESPLSKMFSPNLGINELKMIGSLDKIIDIIYDSIDTVEYQPDQVLKVGDVSTKCGLYTVTIQKESAQKMCVDILKLIRDDPEFYNLAKEMLPFTTMTGNSTQAKTLSEEDYKSDLNKMISQLEDKNNTSNDFAIVQQVFVGKDEQIYGRNLTIENPSDTRKINFQFAHPVAGSKEGLAFAFTGDEQSFNFSSVYTVNSGKITGDAQITFNNEDGATLSFKDVSTKTVGSTGRLLGTIDVAIINVSNSQNTVIPVPVGFSFSGSENGDQYNVIFGIKDMINIKINQKELAAADVVLPSFEQKTLVSITDEAALAGLITPDVQAKLFRIIQKLGLMEMAATD